MIPDTPLHLLYVTPAFPPFTGGGERYARALALELARRGHTLTVVTSHARNEQALWQGAGDAVSEEQDGPLRLIRCPVRPFPGARPGLLAWRKAMVLLSALPGDQTPLLIRMARYVPPIRDLDATLARLPETFDLVTGFNVSWEHALVAGWRFARQRGLPYVVTPFAHLGEGKGTRVARNSMMDHQRRLLADADAVLALTEVERDGFARWGVPTAHVAVVGSGMDPVPPLPDAGPVLARYGLEKPFALFVGRINHDKGALHAAQAVLRLRRRNEAITLALVGRAAPDFERFYRGLTAAEQETIRPVGPIGEAEKHVLLREADVLLLPSRTDSFGIVLLEAWAHGTPVIGARAGGIASVVDDGHDGFLVPFGDVNGLAQAIRRLLTDVPLRRIMGQRGREKIRRKYNWQRVADLVLATYQHTLAAEQTSSQ